MKAGKFKPAPAALTPNVLTGELVIFERNSLAETLKVRKGASGLSSFSTPGFSKLRPTLAALPKYDIINVSSNESTPANPARIPSKRSPDSTLSLDSSPTSKRVKKDSGSNKENAIFDASCSVLQLDKGKGKARDEETWLPQQMDIDSVPNPFEQLDRDFPQFALPRAASLVKSPKPSACSDTFDHSDLNDVCLFLSPSFSPVSDLSISSNSLTF